MYAEHNPIIAAHALKSVGNFVDVVTMVLLTIRQPFHHVGRQMEDIRQNGRDSKYLWGNKKTGYDYAKEHAEVLYAAVKRAVEVNDVVGAIDVLTNVPNLGIAKAGFVAQLCGLDASCLDSHNLKRLGLPEGAFKLNKGIRRDLKLAKIKKYVTKCRRTGGTEFWWNTWCEYVAGRRGSPLLTAEAVSSFHVEILSA